MNFIYIEEEIKEKELKLLDKNIRNNKEELKKLLSKDFIEYGSSGSIYTFCDTINLLPNENNDINYEINKMDIKILSENIVLILYTINMNNIISNRSSIWKKENNEWKIIFHQGTREKDKS